LHCSAATVYFQDAFLFDTVASSWIEITEEVKGTTPVGRANHGLVTVGETIFLFGGYHKGSGEPNILKTL
jgi:hypothetical protein